MKDASFISFNLYAKPKEIFCRIIMPQLERKSEIFVSKFEKFCIKFFDEQNESINYENFPNINDSILKERTFSWKINEENKNDTESKNTNNIISEFFVKILKRISRRIILFFEFDEVFFNELFFSTIPENNNFIMLDDLNENFKLHKPTNCLSDCKLIFFCNYIFCTTQKNSYSIKTKYKIFKSNLIEKLIKSISEIMDVIDSKLENLYLIIKPFLNKRNYDMRFN